jgi:preprotein translocase subunit SecF
MEFFRIKRDLPFMRHALIFNAISFITFAAAVFFLVTRGLHFSIEFTGGSVIEVQYAQSADIGKARAAVESLKFGDVQVQKFGSSRDVLIRLPLRGTMKQGEVVAKVFGALCASEKGQVIAQKTDKGDRQACQAGNLEPLTLQRSEFVGPQVGDELAPWPWRSPWRASCSTWPSASSGSSPWRASSPTCMT